MYVARGCNLRDGDGKGNVESVTAPFALRSNCSRIVRALMPLTVGSRLGPYDILAPLGAGGMGQVWKARDTRLDRIVAIKTSAAAFTDRFMREARAVAA